MVYRQSEVVEDYSWMEQLLVVVVAAAAVVVTVVVALEIETNWYYYYYSPVNSGFEVSLVELRYYCH